MIYSEHRVARVRVEMLRRSILIRTLARAFIVSGGRKMRGTIASQFHSRDGFVYVTGRALHTASYISSSIAVSSSAPRGSFSLSRAQLRVSRLTRFPLVSPVSFFLSRQFHRRHHDLTSSRAAVATRGALAEVRFNSR